MLLTSLKDIVKSGLQHFLPTDQNTRLLFPPSHYSWVLLQSAGSIAICLFACCYKATVMKELIAFCHKKWCSKLLPWKVAREWDSHLRNILYFHVQWLPSFPGVKQQRCGINHPTPSSAEVQKKKSYNSTPQLCLHGRLWGELYLYVHCISKWGKGRRLCIFCLKSTLNWTHRTWLI